MATTALLHRSPAGRRPHAARREAAALADRVEAILRDAAHPQPGLSARAPLQRAQIVAARPFLESLAERLREAEHPRAEGLARARDLVSDGTGPVYVPALPGTLAARAWRAADAL